MTPTEPSTPDAAWDREAQTDRRNARLTLQAERAAQEIERHGKTLEDMRGRLRRWLGG